jgi:hypothetical protein
MHGRKWKIIADELGRTQINVRDKFKSMGEEFHSIRQKDYWTMGELILLIRLIEKRVKKEILNPKITEEFIKTKKEEKEDYVYMDTSRKRKHLQEFDKKMVDFQKIIFFPNFLKKIENFRQIHQLRSNSKDRFQKHQLDQNCQ